MANHCENCGSNFTRSDSLKRHQNVCDIRKNSKMAIQYENCGSNFTRSDSLKRRQNVCDIRKNWRKCDKCGKEHGGSNRPKTCDRHIRHEYVVYYFYKN